MAYMRIHCDYCGQKWEIYERDNFNHWKARMCPHCGSKIDEQTWQRQILPGFGQIADANRELMKDHTGYHRPLFTVDVIADHIFNMVDDDE